MRSATQGCIGTGVKIPMLNGAIHPLVRIGSARTPAVITKHLSAFMRLSSNPGNVVRRGRPACVPVAQYRHASGADLNEWAAESESTGNTHSDAPAPWRIERRGQI